MRQRGRLACGPDRTETARAGGDLKFDLLLEARKIELTGGHIRQITLRAAFVAAADDKPIGLAHVAYAANAELAKLGRPGVVLDLPEGRRVA